MEENIKTQLKNINFRLKAFNQNLKNETWKYEIMQH